jgi:hypothetical protein
MPNEWHDLPAIIGAATRLFACVVLVLAATGLYVAFPIFQDHPYLYVAVVLVLFAVGLIDPMFVYDFFGSPGK